MHAIYLNINIDTSLQLLQGLVKFGRVRDEVYCKLLVAIDNGGVHGKTMNK